MIGWFVLLVAGVVVYRLLLARIRGLEDTLTDQRRTIEDLARRLETISRAQPLPALGHRSDLGREGGPPQPAAVSPRPITTPASTQPAQAADMPRVETPKAVVPPPIIHAPPPVVRPPLAARDSRSRPARRP